MELDYKLEIHEKHPSAWRRSLIFASAARSVGTMSIKMAKAGEQEKSMARRQYIN